MREPLIEIARQESDERRMDPGVRVEAMHRQNPVAMPDRSRGRTGRQPAGTVDRVETGSPEAMDRSLLLGHAIVRLADHGGGGSGVGWHVGPKLRQDRGFFENPRELSPRCYRNTVQHDGAPEVAIRL